MTTPYLQQSDVLRHQPLTRSEIRKGVRRSTMIWWVLCLAVIVAVAGVVHVWVRLQTIKTGYAIAEEKQLQKRLREQNSALSIQLSALKAPKRIEKVARERLKMDFPRPGQVVELVRTSPPPKAGDVTVASP